MSSTTIFTIGHSTRPIETFIALLKHYNIDELVDIRTVAKSRHNPQYNGTELARVLRNHHIGYYHQKDLGGLRHTLVYSLNTAWENSSFRGFADYMQTAEFKKGIQALIKRAHKKTIAIMCSEAVPWRCHRSLIGDALLMHGLTVQDIYSLTSVKPHTMTPWAVVYGSTILYPSKTTQEGLDLLQETEEDTHVPYHISHDTKLLLIGANPSPGTYKRRIPFSSNKMLWYLLHEAGLIDEDRTILKDDKQLKQLYDTKFTQVYHLGILNIANRPTKTFNEIKPAEAIAAIVHIVTAIKKYKPLVVCFIGKRTYELFTQRSDHRYGWQGHIESTRVYVMHTPLHGLARVRVNELKKVGKAAGLLK
jgi:G:T/U-mismatch repair DNA glycosylase